MGERGPNPSRTFKLRAAAAGRDQRVRHYFSVPEKYAVLIQGEQKFECLLTEHGILYRPVDPEPPLEIPAWVQEAKEDRPKPMKLVEEGSPAPADAINQEFLEKLDAFRSLGNDLVNHTADYVAQGTKALRDALLLALEMADRVERKAHVKPLVKKEPDLEPELDEKKVDVTAGDEKDDPLLERAIETVALTQNASVSLLHRQLRVGWTRASRILDVLEERKIVSPPQENSKTRKVLIPPPEKS